MNAGLTGPQKNLTCKANSHKKKQHESHSLQIILKKRKETSKGCFNHVDKTATIKYKNKRLKI